MKKMSKEELAAVLEEHAKWVADPTKGYRAEIVGYEISGEDFPYGVIIRNCTVKYCAVSGGKVSNCTVSDCTVSECKVSYCEVSGGTVSYCEVIGGTVSYCKVSGGTVSYCEVSGGTVSDCTVSECKVSYCKVSGGKVSDCAVSGGKVSNCTVSDCTVSECKVIGGKVSNCTVSGGKVSGKKFISLKGFEGLYRYNVWSVLFDDGSRWVRMGCLFKSLQDWEKEGGVRTSNLDEFPDDGSDTSEERVLAFEFAKAVVLRMKALGE